MEAVAFTTPGPGSAGVLGVVPGPRLGDGPLWRSAQSVSAPASRTAPGRPGWVVFDPGRDRRIDGAVTQAVPFQVAEGQGQHPAADPLDVRSSSVKRTGRGRRRPGSDAPLAADPVEDLPYGARAGLPRGERHVLGRRSARPRPGRKHRCSSGTSECLLPLRSMVTDDDPRYKSCAKEGRHGPCRPVPLDGAGGALRGHADDDPGRHSRHCRPARHPERPGLLRAGPRLGGQRLPGPLRRAAVARRPTRRPVGRGGSSWPASRCSQWPRWPARSPPDRHAGGRAVRAGCRRRSGHGGQPRHDRPALSRNGRTGPRHRRLQLHRGGRRVGRHASPEGCSPRPPGGGRSSWSTCPSGRPS